MPGDGIYDEGGGGGALRGGDWPAGEKDCPMGGGTGDCHCGCVGGEAWTGCG